MFVMLGLDAIFLPFVQCTEGYIRPLKDFDYCIRLPIKSQLRLNFNTSHIRNKRRPRHNFSIFAFVLFVLEKHW